MTPLTKARARRTRLLYKSLFTSVQLARRAEKYAEIKRRKKRHTFELQRAFTALKQAARAHTLAEDEYVAAKTIVERMERQQLIARNAERMKRT